jgi:hypothetical protein
MVALFGAVRTPVLFRGGPFGQLAYDGEHICLLVTGFDDHENRDGEQKAAEEMVKSHEMYGAGVHDGAEPVQQEPDCEQIEPLEGMETHSVVVLEFPGSEHNHGGDPTDNRDVAKD